MQLGLAFLQLYDAKVSENYRIGGRSTEQAQVGLPTIKRKLKKFLSFIQSTVKCYDILWHLIEFKGFFLLCQNKECNFSENFLLDLL